LLFIHIVCDYIDAALRPTEEERDETPGDPRRPAVHSGYSAAARDFCRLFQGLFDRIVGVDIHFSSERPYERFPYPLVPEEEARTLAAQADFALALSFTTPDCYARYAHAVNVGLTFWETDRLPLQGQEHSPWVGHANSMDALWAPSSHTRTVFQTAGVTVPVRVIPWPIRMPGPTPAGLPDGTIWDLNRRPGSATPWWPRHFKANRYSWSRRLMDACARRPRGAAEPAAVSDTGHRGTEGAGPALRRPGRAAQGLLLFLSEWLEFKRRPEAAPGP